MVNCCNEVVFTATLPKVREAGLTAITAPEPVPVNTIVWVGFAGSLLLMFTLPLYAPTAAGVNVRLYVLVLLAFIE